MRTPISVASVAAVIAGVLVGSTTPVSAACADAAGPNVDWSNCSLTFSQLNGADLRNANLAGVDLSYSTLFQADLRNANLRGAKLKDAFPVGANLSGADLTSAIIVDADLVGADLTGATLAGADLRRADLDFATITDADFSGANLTSADFASVTGADAAVFVRAPEGVDDLGAVRAGASGTINVLENDDPAGVNPFATMSIATVSQPANGSFDAATGVYTPDAGFAGIDRFTYRPAATLTVPNLPTAAVTEVAGSTATVTVRVVRRVQLEAPYAGASGDRGEIARLYVAVFNRAPDAEGFDYWLGQRRAGVPLARVASSFLDSSEFLGGSATLSNGAFVDLLYLNVFGRNADEAGRAFWIGELAGGLPRAELIVAFANADELKQLTGTS